MGLIHHWTIFCHFMFFTFITGVEFLLTKKAPFKFIEPMKHAPKGPQEYTFEMYLNLAFRFMFFGVRKYHLLCTIMTFLIWIYGKEHSPESKEILPVQQYTCLLLGIHFLIDNMHFECYLQYVPKYERDCYQPWAFLIPAYDISLFWVDNENTNFIAVILFPILIVSVPLAISVWYGYKRQDLRPEIPVP